MRLRWRFAQFFEFHWWKNYLKAQDTAAYLGWKKRYWEQFLEKGGLFLPPDAAVLDAGCGPAGIFIALHTRCQVEATDPLLARYAERLPVFKPAYYPGVRFFDAPIEHFSPGKQYDFVFCLNAINHVADLSRCFDRLTALTKPGGRLVLSVDAHNSPFLKYLFQFFPGDILHPHQYGLQDYVSMLKNRNFQVERAVLMKKSGIFNYYLIIAQPGAMG